MRGTKSANEWVNSFDNISKAALPLVGGKGANLGELKRIAGINIPDGFCVSTKAFQQMLELNTSISISINQLSHLRADDRKDIEGISRDIRRQIESAPIPMEIEEAVTDILSKFGEANAYAVRSSATAEDLPMASFAGQQDTYLNIIGRDDILRHISKCWASLFTERAIVYRIQNDFDHHKVHIAVVVQKMILPEVSGILFTADPITSNRKVVSIDASFGLGEALVSGIVTADNYKVRDGVIIDKTISSKKLAIYPVTSGGTQQQEIETSRQTAQTLTDANILQLEYIGRKIEQHFGSPQDIEWCSANDIIYIVQSRPVTTLFPVPELNVPENRVYVSTGHQQMMTDAMKPLGLSVFLLTTFASMHVVGGRLFVDASWMLRTSAGRQTMFGTLGKSDPLIRDAFSTLADRDFIKLLPEENKEGSAKEKSSLHFQALIDYDPTIVPDLIRNSQAHLVTLKQNIKTKAGSELFDFILEDIQQLKKTLWDPKNMNVVMTSMNAALWINEKMQEWLGEKNAADILSLSVPNNITSEMGLELLDVADVIRPFPEVIGYLKKGNDENYADELLNLKGGRKSLDAIRSFLEKYGMRCAGEIDITRPRWSEKPATLFAIILSNIKNLEPNESSRKFERGKIEAANKAQDLLTRLQALPDGDQKVQETKRMIELVRNYAGYREYPKYNNVSRFFVYKQALLEEARRLVGKCVIHEVEDIFYLSFAELQEVARTGAIDYEIIDKRKQEFRIYEKLTPPRVITSEGEVIAGKYNRDHMPTNAIVGLAVSSGIVEGRARVILDMAKADIEEGDILITSFTDPSWTPLFISIKGLVTEVGGLMTHGAVIAREYGLPAVVGVENATQLIKDGQQIRVNGIEGFIEIL
jgi:phosphoenolpyruvate synthase/pyruvate phosphate dikinase